MILRKHLTSSNPSLPVGYGATINVKDHGAVGDGVVDDTAAFQSAVTEAKATKRPVHIPAGNYLVSGLAMDLDWEGATVTGPHGGLGGAIITTTSTTVPVLKCPGDYNQLHVSNLRIYGPGRATSTGYGIELRGDLEGGTNIDFLNFSNVTVSGFGTDVYAKGVANSTFDRCGFEHGTKGCHILGNSNSVSFQNCAFVSTVGLPADSYGIHVEAGCNGIVIESCDMGGSGHEWCVLDDGQNTSIHGGQWECYRSGVWSTNRLIMSGTYIRQFGTPANDRWSVRTADATLTGVRMGVVNSSTGAVIRCDSTISRNLFVYGVSNALADFYASGVFNTTNGVVNFPVETQASGEGASAASHGAVWKRVSSGSNDVLNINVKNAAGAYAWANLFDYHFDKAANGAPAFIGAANTFASSQRVTNASNPGFSITTSTYGGGATQAGLFIATAVNNVALGTQVSDTVVVAKTGGDLALATASAGSQTIRAIVPQGGIVEYADNAAAITAGLRVNSFYRTGDIIKIVH